MKKFIYSLVLFLPVLVLSQSTNQNYVKSTTYKKATTAPLPASPNAAGGLVNVTYFDGLGRPVQQVAHKQSATGKDIITHIEYDVFGRQVKDYLPYASTSQSNMGYIESTSAVSETISYYQALYDDAFPYSEKQFEPSPLNRVLKQGAPGEDWRIMSEYASDNTIKFNYKANAGYEVKLFKANISATPNAYGVYTISLGNASGDVYYTENELYKTTALDENNSIIAEFKDKEGRVVLKRNYDGIDTNYENMFSHSTYYIYDIYGNLTYVIPPKAVDSQIISPTVLNELCYQYRYDARNRLVEKKLPGKAWEYIVYDKLDRVVATGPALSPFSNITGTGWLVTKYDVLGRVAYTGWSTVNNATTSALRNSLQVSVNGGNIYVNRQTTTINGVQIGYDVNNVQPLSSAATFHLLTVNYYDDYSYPNPPATLPPFSITDTGEHVTNQTRGLPTGSWVRVLTTTSEKLFEMTHTFYDKKARPIRSYQKNYLEGYTQTDTKLDFTGNPEYTITKHKRLNADTEITVREDFEYTPQGRLLKHNHKINNLTAETLSHNAYDELGQLKTKKVGRNESNPLQTVNYDYNIRGWLTDINDVDSLGDDLFAFKISYNQIAHPSTGSGMPAPYYYPLYNGNISETYWKTSSDNVLRKYGYKYDKLNRLTNALYIKPGISSANSLPTGSYNESVYYDKNGNITSIWRHGDLDSDVDRIEIDRLAYTYDQGNRLMRVSDASNHPEGFKDGADNDDEYGYDDLGNMIRDDNKGITGITYNHLNLPKEIVFENNPNKKIIYLYDAMGKKVQKGVMTSGTTFTITTYLEGFHYEMGNNTLFVNELKFFATAQGYINVITNRTTGARRYKYVYNYTDHLGNIRVSYTENENPNLPPIMIEENHYYPFGLKHKRYGMGDPVPALAYKYKAQNKEWQDELGLNVYDFEARNYMPDLGRTTTLDPLAEMFYDLSPYSFLNNNPLSFVDPMGMASEEWLNKDGELVYDTKRGEYTKNATEQDKQFGEALRNSGDTGANQFKALTESEAKIKVTIQEGGERMLNEQGHLIIENYNINSDGSVTLIDASLNVSLGANKNVHELIMSDEIKNYALTPQQNRNIDIIKKNSLSYFDMSVATFGHEIEHTNNSNVKIQLMELGILKGYLKGGESELKPQSIEGKILSEISQKKN